MPTTKKSAAKVTFTQAELVSLRMILDRNCFGHAADCAMVAHKRLAKKLDIAIATHGKLEFSTRPSISAAHRKAAK